MKDKLFFALGVALAATLALLGLPAGAAKLHWSGYGNAHWMDMEGAPNLTTRDFNDSVLQLREFSLFLDVAVNDDLMISAELEAAQNASELSFNYAYVTWSPKDWLSVKAGKILVPFLRYNDEKPNFKQNLMNPPFTASLLAPVVNLNTQVVKGLGWSDSGAQVEGRWAGAKGVVSASAAWINGLGSDDPAALDANVVMFADGTPTGGIRPRNGLIENEADGLDNGNNKAVVARVLYTGVSVPIGIGFSYYTGKWDPNGEHSLDMWGINAEYRAARWEIKGEWGRANVEQEAGLVPLGANPLLPPNLTTGDYTMEALWLESAWRFHEYGQERWFKAVLRYDDADPNDEAMFTPFRRSRWTVGMEWQFNPNARFRYQYEQSKIRNFNLAPAPIADSMGEKPKMHMASLIFWF